MVVNLSEKVDATCLITDSLIVSNTGLIVETTKETGIIVMLHKIDKWSMVFWTQVQFLSLI